MPTRRAIGANHTPAKGQWRRAAQPTYFIQPSTQGNLSAGEMTQDLHEQRLFTVKHQ